jgi:hypothetical protein
MRVSYGVERCGPQDMLADTKRTTAMTCPVLPRLFDTGISCITLLAQCFISRHRAPLCQCIQLLRHDMPPSRRIGMDQGARGKGVRRGGRGCSRSRGHHAESAEHREIENAQSLPTGCRGRKTKHLEHVQIMPRRVDRWEPYWKPWPDRDILYIEAGVVRAALLNIVEDLDKHVASFQNPDLMDYAMENTILYHPLSGQERPEARHWPMDSLRSPSQLNTNVECHSDGREDALYNRGRSRHHGAYARGNNTTLECSMNTTVRGLSYRGAATHQPAGLNSDRSLSTPVTMESEDVPWGSRIDPHRFELTPAQLAHQQRLWDRHEATRRHSPMDTANELPERQDASNAGTELLSGGLWAIPDRSPTTNSTFEFESRDVGDEEIQM